MYKLLSVLSCLVVVACTPVDYVWQDRYNLNREDYSADLSFCSEYAAQQYRPGVPAGVPYLAENAGYPHGLRPVGAEDVRGEWHPDRNPMRWIAISSSSVHQVNKDYTGYPGTLDYSPDFTDAILEKCMQDRGWGYLPVNAAR